MSIKTIIYLLLLGVAIIIHEISHGYIAYKLGDPTAKNQGRLSFNPIVHIDPLGSILLPLALSLSGSSFLFGWAKPVPINPQYFKNPQKGMMWVALAGPVSNICLALCSSLILHSVFSGPITNISIAYWQHYLTYFIFLNIILAIFNLVPIPPLDGSRILLYFSPYKIQYLLLKIEPYGFPIIFLLAYLNFFSIIIGSIAIPIAHLLI